MMKKITLLLMLLTGIAFGQTYKGHTVKRLTGLNETQAKNLVCSGASTSSYRTRKFDIRTNTKFPVGTLLFLDKPGETGEYGYYYVTYSKDTGFADEDENFDGIYFTKITVICDNDNDGVPNDQDQCPNEAGTSSNNGCPLDGPGIEIEKIIIKNTNNQSIIYDSSSPSSLTLNKNTSYDFQITLKNTSAISKRPEFVHYYSSNNSLSVTNDCPIQSSARGSSLSPGSSITQSYSVYVSNTNQANNCTINAGYFFFNADIDQNGTPISTNIYFNYSTSKSLNARVNLLLLDDNTSESYTINIFDLNGQKILTSEVSSVEEENITVDSLPKSIYIIKSPKGDRKVSN